jgi:molybdopterin-containing oxidoreductase family membrane subunit
VPAVILSGVGHRVSHNVIQDHPHCAILFSGNEHRIEYNEIHSVCYESNDAGAIYSGFAMVLTLTIPIRWLYRLDDFITARHLRNMANVMLATGLMVAYGYLMEIFFAWYSGNPLEMFTFLNRALGPYAWAYWIMITCNVLVPQIFWSKKARTNLWILMAVSILVNVGMWFERFVIIVISLHREFLPANWGYFAPSWVDICTYLGTFGLFFTCFLLFLRFLPMIAISEIKGVTPFAEPHPAHDGMQTGGPG